LTTCHDGSAQVSGAGGATLGLPISIGRPQLHRTLNYHGRRLIIDHAPSDKNSDGNPSDLH